MQSNGIKVLLLGACTSVFWCFSIIERDSTESFLMPEKYEQVVVLDSKTGDVKTSRRVSRPGQLKQEIVKVMGDLLTGESCAIETRAKIQQTLGKHIRSYAESDKKSFFARASARELHKLLKALRKEKELQQKEQAERERFLASLRSL